MKMQAKNLTHSRSDHKKIGGSAQE